MTAIPTAPTALATIERPHHPFPDAEIGLEETPQARCTVCKQVKPATDEEFERLASGRLREHCRNCEGPAREIRQALKRARQVRAAAVGIVAATRGNKVDAPGIMMIYAGMMKEFGGVAKFCNAWKGEIDVARKERPGSKTVLDQFYAMFKMGALVGEQTLRVVGDLTDEELGEELAEVAMNVLPGLAEAAGALESIEDEDVVDVSSEEAEDDDD